MVFFLLLLFLFRLAGSRRREWSRWYERRRGKWAIERVIGIGIIRRWHRRRDGAKSIWRSIVRATSDWASSTIDSPIATKEWRTGYRPVVITVKRIDTGYAAVTDVVFVCPNVVVVNVLVVGDGRSRNRVVDRGGQHHPWRDRSGGQ